MAKLHVSRRELGRAFTHLRDASAAELRSPRTSRVAASAILLGLYAVECGLKLLLLVRRGLHSTARLADDDLTHDPNLLLEQLGHPQRFPHRVAQAPHDTPVPPGALHELYRYGGSLDSGHETRLRQDLLDLFSYIDENAP